MEKLLFAIALIFLCNYSNAQVPKVKMNGVYQSKKNDDYWYYIKFINDSIVIEVSSTGTPEEIKNWFNVNHDGVSSGRYIIDGSKIEFSVSDGGQSVKYIGKIYEDKLMLGSLSHINGHIDLEKYIFVRYD